MCADGEQVDIVCLHVDGNLADSLDAIHGEKDAALFCDFTDFRDRIDYANFVIGVHDGDQNRFRRNRFAHVLRIDTAIALNREIGHFKSIFFKALAGIENRLVFDGLRDDVIAFFTIHLGHALDHQVVAFRGAAGEDDFFGRSAYQRGDLSASVLNGFFAGPTEWVVAAGSISEFFREIRQHCLNDARIHLSRRVIIEINWQLHSHVPVSCYELYARRATSTCSCGSSHICEMVTVFKT